MTTAAAASISRTLTRNFRTSGGGGGVLYSHPNHWVPSSCFCSSAAAISETTSSQPQGIYTNSIPLCVCVYFYSLRVLYTTVLSFFLAGLMMKLLQEYLYVCYGNSYWFFLSCWGVVKCVSEREREGIKMVKMVAISSWCYHFWPWNLANLQKAGQGVFFVLLFCYHLIGFFNQFSSHSLHVFLVIILIFCFTFFFLGLNFIEIELSSFFKMKISFWMFYFW